MKISCTVIRDRKVLFFASVAISLIYNLRLLVKGFSYLVEGKVLKDKKFPFPPFVYKVTEKSGSGIVL